ncbi:MAG: hypothetical protein H7Z37_09515 [Pyrinomonadaceae bacterium]|nr:hypothetical protein [Pyrinomonadaceae bacterium]
MKQNIPDSLQVLLTEIVDYAGLFPPANVSMATAVQNYANYLQHEKGFMLGRFIVPAARLKEFAGQANQYWTSGKTWRVSALAGENVENDVTQIASFNANYEGKAVVDAFEVKVSNPTHIKTIKESLPFEIKTYFEIPLGLNFNDFIAKLAVTKSRAKIRTGGIVQEAFPPVDEVVKFLRVCMAANIPLKATAGLHHPLRTTKPLTYEPDSVTGTMHGFLNVFLSAAYLRQNLNSNFVHKLMSETEAKNFSFDDDGVTWNAHRLEITELQVLRAKGVMSFGSCSFVEPVEDLQALGLL